VLEGYEVPAYSRFGDFVDRIYPIELEIKDTTDTDRSALYLVLHLEIDSEGRLRTKQTNVVNQKLEHVDDISFRDLFGRIRVVFYKILSVPS
jgi:hypothetical protein